MLSDDPVLAFVEGFSPPSAPKEAAAFARRVVARASPQSTARAKALCLAASRLARFALEIGLELEEHVLFSDEAIERFCGTKKVGTLASRRTYRANLRFLGRRVLVHPPRPAVMPRDPPKPPYSPAEIASYLALGDAQPTKLRRMRANALICLGAGAGLIGGELRSLRGHDVIWRSGGLVVEVTGRRARVVPVLGDYHERLAEPAAFFGPAYLVSGTKADSHNVTTPLVRSLSGGSDLPRLECARLRSTYLCQMAEAIGLKAFMDAAGIACSQRLGDLVSHLASPSEEEAITVLGATRR